MWPVFGKGKIEEKDNNNWKWAICFIGILILRQQSTATTEAPTTTESTKTTESTTTTEAPTTTTTTTESTTKTKITTKLNSQKEISKLRIQILDLLSGFIIIKKF